MKITKRRFLQTVGSIGGVGAVYRSMQALGMTGIGTASASQLNLPSGSGDGRSVAILGAGISGLVAAYELSKVGYRCTILEAAERAGGRNLTARSGDLLEENDSRQHVKFGNRPDLYANMGPARIPYHHRSILAYCKDFGVELEVFTNDNRAALFHNRERFDGQAVVSRQVNTDMRGYIAELLAKAIDRKALDSEFTSEDEERILSMLKKFGDLDDNHQYKGSSRGGFKRRQINAGLKSGEVNSPLAFSELLQSDFWIYKLHFDEFLNQNPTLFQPVGGMDKIVNAFVERVGSLIQYRSIVKEIRKSADGVRIVVQQPANSAQAVAVNADFAVCTIPAPVLAEIPNDFSADFRSAIESLEFVPAVKIAFQSGRRFWEEDQAIYGGISWTDQDITQIWYPPYGYHRENGIIMGAYIWGKDPGLRFSQMTPQERLQAAINQGEQIHSGYADEITTGISRAWLNVPFQKGAWAYSNEIRETLQKPDGPIYFAGDQVTALPGWQEGAVLAAHAAVKGISERIENG